MKAAVIKRYGGPEVIGMEERPDPEPREGHVIIRVRAAGVNFADIAARLGLYPDAPKAPLVVGYEVAGEVESKDPGAAGLDPGTRVLAVTIFGGYAEKASVPAEFARPIPEGWSFEEAAAMPVNYLTAHHALIYMANLKKGESVLVHSAAGGVGTAAIQICNATGAKVIGTASAAKHDYVKELGAMHVIDYNKEDFVKQVKRITEGRGVDVALDAVGGANFKKSYQCLGQAGRLVAFGMSSAITGLKRNFIRAGLELLRTPRFSPFRLMNANKAVIGVNLNHLAQRPEIMSGQIDALIEMAKEGRIRPHVDRTFPLEKAGEAHLYIQERKNRGKVVLTVS